MHALEQWSPAPVSTSFPRCGTPPPQPRDWTTLSSASGEWTPQLPSILTALVCPSPMVRGVALSRLREEVLLEGEVFPLTAAVMSHLMPLLTHVHADRLALATLILDCGMAARTQVAHGDALGTAARSGALGTLDAIREGIGHLQDCYSAHRGDARLVGNLRVIASVAARRELA